MKCTDKNQIKSTRAGPLVRPIRAAGDGAALGGAAALCVSSIQTTPTGRGLHLFGAALSFSVFLPWDAAAPFWAPSLALCCAEAAAAALEDLEACVGFEVELEGCRRRLPSSPAEDE